MADPGIALSTTAAGTRFTDAAGIDNFFQQGKGRHYISWFNAQLANKGPWTGVTLVESPDNELGFHRFWNQIPILFGGGIGLAQFVSLMSIISNEQRGDFTPRTEKMGIAGHPGMAYLFDRIEGKKRSYNTLAGNRTAFQCFNDPDYLAAHGTLPLADRLARTTDARWSGDVYPAEFPNKSDLATAGFIMQADFMKFRGRGFIQTTSRPNYLPLIEFVQQYQGDNDTIDFYQHRWTGMTADQIASVTTNDDWDRLFQQSDLIIPCEAVRVHSVKSRNYLQLSEEPAKLNGSGPGSVNFMGLSISGSSAYATTFQQRVAAVLAAV